MAALAAGCATAYKKNVANLDKPPINCFTAEGDVRVLRSEKANVTQQMAAGLSAIVPTSIVVGLVTGTEGTKAQVESGEVQPQDRRQDRRDQIDLRCAVGRG